MIEVKGSGRCGCVDSSVVVVVYIQKVCERCGNNHHRTSSWSTTCIGPQQLIGNAKYHTLVDTEGRREMQQLMMVRGEDVCKVRVDSADIHAAGVGDVAACLHFQVYHRPP